MQVVRLRQCVAAHQNHVRLHSAAIQAHITNVHKINPVSVINRVLFTVLVIILLHVPQMRRVHIIHHTHIQAPSITEVHVAQPQANVL